MYSFVDVNQRPLQASRPAEAFSYNGTWIDDVVDGFRTLNVSGRELMPKTINSYSIAENVNGAYYRSSKYGTRTITITYQLKASSNENFRTAYNKLNELLSKNEVKVIFNDEPDKYFIASKANNSAVKAGSNSVTGTIELICLDPLKYATDTRMFGLVTSSGERVLNVFNRGNVPVPIDYEIKCTGENGYIGLTCGDKIMEYGSVDETDTATRSTRVRLLTGDEIYTGTNGTGTSAFSSSISLTGTLAKQNITTAGTSKSWLVIQSVSSRTPTYWAGQKTVTLSQTASDFNVSFRRWFNAATVKEAGFQYVCVYAGTSLICASQLMKRSAVNFNADVTMWGSTKALKTMSYTTASTEANPYYSTRGMDYIEKKGQTLTFYFNNQAYSFDVPEIANKSATKVVLIIGGIGNNDTLTRNHIGGLTFDKLNVIEEYDVRNKYAPNDLVEIVGSEGRVYVNGVVQMGDEIIGTEYFKAEAGSNRVVLNTSSWMSGSVTAYAEIREAWI